MTSAQPISFDLSPSQIAADAIKICCYQCKAPLSKINPQDRAANARFVCLRCVGTTLYKDGIWRSISAGDAVKYERFIAEYEQVRAAESRGSDDPAYYRALPFEDITGKLSDQWRIRAVTFRHIERYILTPLAAKRGRPLRILDLGAGNGWLSYRLALLGHQPVAVDLLINQHDGLGAAMHYVGHLVSLFPCVQANLDCLPFADGTFDLVIFNASFHYSTDYTVTLAEALRCTREKGQVVIADTAWYRDEASGLRMLDEKHARFRSTFGFASDSLASLEFLTPQRLERLARILNIDWHMLKPFYGLRWALRPLRAKIAGSRPPSRFRIFVTEVKA